MKKIIISFSIMLLMTLAVASCSDGDRIDQRGGIPVPQEPTVVDIKSVPGGAVLTIRIPDDPNLKGVVATYERNGQIVESRISRYIDTLEIKGYADLEEHEVKVASFNADDVKSEVQTVKITPLVAPVNTVEFEAFESFGGFKAIIKNNPTLAKLALVVQCDQNYVDQDLTYEQRKWKDVSTFFTESNSVIVTRRGLEAVPTVFAFHFRDDFGNVSETKMMKLTPKAEAPLVKSKFKHYPLSDDNFVNDPNGGGVGALWDNVTTGTGHFFLAAKGCPIPTWLTIDLGQLAVLSRIATKPRADYMPFGSGNIREWEFWGCPEDPSSHGPMEGKEANPTDPDYAARHGFKRGWVMLAKGEQYKPSGYAPNGSVDGWTQEDRDWYLNKTEYEVDNTNPLTPDAYTEIRFLRIVVINTFDSWEYNQTTGGWFIGEITPYGQVNE